MSRTARRALYAQIRAEETRATERYVDLRADYIAHDRSEHFMALGGRYDRKAKRFDDSPAASCKLFKLHPGQYEAGRWFAAWMRGYLEKRPIQENGRVIRSMLLAGGRRGGKSDLGVKVGVGFALAVPKSRVWLVSPSIPETEELELALLDWLPRRWYNRLGAPWYRFLLPNWSTITLRSGHDPEALKRGRADFVVLNEAQRMHERVFAIVRPQTADQGGLVVLCANPPEDPVGQWIADMVEETQAGRRPTKYIHLDASKNPYVDQRSLDDLALEVDERTYRVERHGEFLPRLDIVFHSWSPTLNIQPRPDVGNVTR